MKNFFIFFAEFMILVNTGAKDFKFHPNLPLGEYRVNVIATQQCNANPNSSLRFNFFLFKTSRTTTELRGNISAYNIAFDDSLLFRGNLAVKDTIGGWQNNAYVYNSPQAYTSLKKLFGPEFPFFLKSFGVNDTIHNSIPPGIYTTKGYDISKFPANTNLPKQVFYGTYKTKVIYLDKKGNEVGCFSFTVEIKRPWETE
ncbi:uncharacterized protein LOC100572796 [Acyrthosiphon pisum]|uniref:Uncharacterized protein n=1 Tax=Acyrthosiphon pisum TaxID=7029 RepID=A0A8R2A777_ACYPI|nr:uncharacterized protein LOC100572796 [Acyrthosiphon pisum]|eukprot:XP_003243324.1 PREDICTED: uncharacterized protein LOC100572796 [Acyrthosiphon pisum]